VTLKENGGSLRAKTLRKSGMLADYFKEIAEEKWPLTINIVITHKVKESLLRKSRISCGNACS
jgi:hypothetical protein